MDYIKAFLIGGLICAAVQILLDRTKLMPGRVMVLLVCTGAVLGFIGAYEPFVKFAGAGASVPLLGFGNVLWKGVKEAVDKNGFLGIFLGGFKASAAGISAALIFGYLASGYVQAKTQTMAEVPLESQYFYPLHALGSLSADIQNKHKASDHSLLLFLRYCR